MARLWSLAKQRAFLREHRVHQYADLITEWRKIARDANCLFRPFAKVSGHQVYFLSTRHWPKKEDSEQRGFYASAGVHGDESAAPWGLLEWAREHLASFEDPLILFPCLNPWGLLENNRLLEDGQDLNRRFHDLSNPLIQAWREKVEGKRFQVALSLHEDYDAQGMYVYDLMPSTRATPANQYLQKLEKMGMPRDSRPWIDARKSNNGVIVRKNLKLGALTGLPEAVYLRAEKRALRALTFETPSEFCLCHRIQIHAELVKLAFA